MAIMERTELRIDHKFNNRTCRHFQNCEPYVLHCHHYATLYSQLADDCGMLDGKKMLFEVAEDTFRNELKNYYDKYDLTDLADRVAIAEQYYATSGLGQLKVKSAGPNGGEVELLNSHIDEGWIKKWGKRDKPVNFITQGYVAGLFEAIFDHSRRSYQVIETRSIVKGDESSQFQVVSI